MGTRSNINVKVGNVYQTVYTNWNGYPEGVGLQLVMNYNSQELAEKLVSNGDMSSVHESCDKPEGHTFDDPVPGYTVYYGRDRGETGTDMQIRNEIRFEEDYVYVWDGEKWIVNGYDLDNVAVVEVLYSQLEVKDENEPAISDGDKVFKYFGCSIDEVIDINNEWAVTFNTDDPRMTDGYNERQRWALRHRNAPYQGVDAEGIWHHTFFGRTLYEAAERGKEYLQRGKDFESTSED